MGAKIFTVAAGKGGVGKSFITASLGITLSKLNKSVCLIDIDLAGANLHSHLGLSPTTPSLQDFFQKQMTLDKLVKATAIPRLSYIQGAWEDWGQLADENPSLSQELVTQIRALPFDYVILDLGPGASKTNLDLFSAADQKILVTSGEPTSIEKTYRFLESSIIHHAATHSTPEALQQLRTTLKSFRAEKKTGHFSFRDYLQTQNGFSFDYFDLLKAQPVRILLNGTRSHQDQQLGHSIKNVCSKYFDISLDYLGYVDFDNAVWHSVRNREPFLIAKPFTTLSGQFLSLAKSLVDPEINSTFYRAVV